MIHMRRIAGLALAALLLLPICAGCGASSGVSAARESNAPTNLPFEDLSLRDVPGVTENEIREIDKIRAQYRTLIYGSLESTESFYTGSGAVSGFDVLFCQWLTNLFNIPFQTAIFNRDDLLWELKNGSVQFTGELTSDETRVKGGVTTDAIAERTIKMIRLEGKDSLLHISENRPVRLALIEDSSVADSVMSTFEQGAFETVPVENARQAYAALHDGRADAYFCPGGEEIAFISYQDVTVSSYIPLISQPIALSTQILDLSPIISVVQKALQNGAFSYLSDLYNQGQTVYSRHMLFSRLTAEERAYIREHPVIPYVTQYRNFPVSYYDVHEQQWFGSSLVILDEIEKLTGLSFQRAHGDTLIKWPELLAMVDTGQAAFVTELTHTEAREGLYLWPKMIMSNCFVLISRMDQRNYGLEEIQYLNVGVVRNTAQTAAFLRWFPQHTITEFDDTRDAIDALVRGELDLVMTDAGNFLSITNFQEVKGCRTNITFDNLAQKSSFGFNANEAVLCSIFDKTLKLINTDKIINDWKTRVLDYNYKILDAQRPWLIGVSCLLLFVVLLLIVFFQRSLREGRRLEKIVRTRTADLSTANTNLETALEAAQAADRAKSTFLANMSHEIRTPMNSILGMTQIQLRSSSLDPQAKEALHKIYSSGDMLLGIINDILDISKIEAGKMELTPTKYETASLIHDITTLNMMRAGRKPIEFTLHVDENTPAILFGDELRIKQILSNLLSNSFKYTERGAVSLSVSTQAGSEDDVTLILQVSDTGQGMAQEQIEKLFDQYSRFNMDTNRTIEGTGLGMSIVQEMIHLMNGTISVESEMHKGSVFTVRLPQKTTGSAVLGKDLTERLQEFQLGGHTKTKGEQLVYEPMPDGTILVVDDVELNLEVVQGLLEPYGLKIDTVLSGFDAIEKIQNGQVYDIIFMDHMMPRMDGIETTKRLRKIGYTRPIVALTANALTGQSEIFLANGFDDFISKPINVYQTDALLKKYVRDKGTREEFYRKDGASSKLLY